MSNFFTLLFYFLPRIEGVTLRGLLFLATKRGHKKRLVLPRLGGGYSSREVKKC